MSMRRHSLINVTILFASANVHLCGKTGLHVSRVSAERIDKDFGKKMACSNSLARAIG